MTTTTAQGPFLSVTEMAAELGVSRSTAYSLVKERAVPSLLLRGRIRVPAGALDRWLAGLEQESLDAVRSDPS
jgi:excisionase family DNA binding protein